MGHTPFGHAGERILNEIYSEGFRHQEQSVRVVECLEKDGEGLNLTVEVRDGIRLSLIHIFPVSREQCMGKIEFRQNIFSIPNWELVKCGRRLQRR